MDETATSREDVGTAAAAAVPADGSAAAAEGAASASASDEELKGYLRDRDVECPSCRYNLRDLSSSRCPECGLGLSVYVLCTKDWVTGSLSMTAGLAGLSIGALISVYAMTALMVAAITAIVDGEVAGALLALLLMGLCALPMVALVQWLKRARRIVHYSPWLRVLLVALCWWHTWLLGALVVVFVVLVRW